MAIRLNGSTSGYVELDAPATAGSNTLVLPNGDGNPGEYLQTDGLGALSWGSITPNKIVQVVHNSGTITTTNPSTTTWDTLLTQTITLSSASNYVLVFAKTGLYVNGNTTAYGETGVFHTDTSGTKVAAALFGQASGTSMWQTTTMIGKHEPASTAQQTYVVAMKPASSGTSSVQSSSETHTIILVEVAA